MMMMMMMLVTICLRYRHKEETSTVNTLNTVHHRDISRKRFSKIGDLTAVASNSVSTATESTYGLLYRKNSVGRTIFAQKQFQENKTRKQG
jgi:hypothetical protein